MEFDKTRVYTAVNAEELEIGSTCIFANTIQDLKDSVQAGIISTLIDMLDESVPERFIGSDGYVEITYSLAYLIKPPENPVYKPFSSVDKAMEAIKKHGGWVNDKMLFSFLITAYDKNQIDHSVCLNNSWYNLQELYDSFIFADDGSPCGELVEG